MLLAIAVLRITDEITKFSFLKKKVTYKGNDIKHTHSVITETNICIYCKSALFATQMLALAEENIWTLKAMEE